MNRHAAADNDEANSQPHHSLREQMGQLVDRERVLISENDQLRAQLVEMKEQEKKKYDDLMVQYNMKREYEDDGLDNGTAANQVTVKTEWDDEDVKVEMKVEIKEEHDQGDHDILIKQEQLDDQSPNRQQQMDNEDPDTNAHNVNIKTEPMDFDFVVVKEDIKEEDNEEDRDIFFKQQPDQSHNGQQQMDNEDPNAHNVTLNIKTEPMDCDFVVVKEEIKEEDECDDCDGCDRWIVKKEEVSDDDEVDNDGHGLPIDEVNDEDGVVRGGDNYEVDDEPNVDGGELLSNPSRDNQNASNVNESIDEGDASLESQEQIANAANQSNEQTQSDDLLSPSTSTGQGSNRTASTEQATVSTGRNANKRKQAALNRSGKRSKQTIGDGDDDEEIANEDREETKVKIVYLNCTESNCTAKLDSVVHLHDHLRTVHQLSPLQCFAMNCNARFDNRGQIGDHIKLSHFQNTRFDCAVCHAEYDSQHNTYNHWYHIHLTGQFECNLMDDCAQVTDNRNKMNTHHQTAHHIYSKHIRCTHPGCTATFSFKAHLKRHELTHLDSHPFHCDWLNCNHRTNQRAHLVRHIRTQHFGLPRSVKEQKANNIEDQRDPNEYVRVVVD